MIRQLVTSFIAGSSFPAFVLFFLAVQELFRRGDASYSYFGYSLAAPFFLGLMAALAKFISLRSKLNLKTSYLMVSVLSASIICFRVSRKSGVYTFTDPTRWYLQYLLIFVWHLFVYNVIIYNIDVYLS